MCWRIVNQIREFQRPSGSSNKDRLAEFMGYPLSRNNAMEDGKRAPGVLVDDATSLYDNMCGQQVPLAWKKEQPSRWPAAKRESRRRRQSEMVPR